MNGWTRGLGVALVAALVVLTGCGDDDGPADGDGDGGAGADARMATVDAGGEMDAGCVHTGDPLLDPTLLEACPLCENARCISASLVPEDTRDQLADCADGRKCVPDLFIETNGDFLLPTCRSLADAEGRCLSTCLPAVADQIDLLPVSTCGSDERCVPCFDPTTGEATGACGLSCDPGPAEPPVSFDRCCFDLGSCVPTEAVPVDQRDLLGPDTCGEAALCAPDDLTDSSFIPPTCRSVADAEGRCLPACLPAVAAQADTLPQDTCAANHLCVPCYDPIDGTETGSCGLNGDAPTEPPTVFAGCCTFGGTDRGRCVPETSIPADDRGALPQDDCTTGDLCIPELLLLDPSASFPSCTTGGVFSGDPGACLPDCMVGGFESIFLAQTTCADGELCAPCTNPLDGSTTGACR